MPRIPLNALERFIHDALSALGLSKEHAANVTEVYMRSTLRGVGHHDIYTLPSRLRRLAEGTIDPRPEIKPLHKFNALENYDGGNGLGEVCSWFLIEQTMRLAAEYGIGFAAIRHSNHFLAAAPYVEMAAEEGYLALIFSRTEPIMGAPGTTKRVIGNQPLGFAAAADGGPPLMLDICLAYASIGKFLETAKQGGSVPDYWGLDGEGNRSTDPGLIAKTGTSLPIAGHKGFGLALLVEILTGILAEAPVIDEQSPYPAPDGIGPFSQAAMVIKPEGLLGPDGFAKRNAEMLARLSALDPGIQIPGRRSAEIKAQLLGQGWIELEEGLLKKLNEWAERLGVGGMG